MRWAWWPSADGSPWQWQWEPQLGAGLLVLALAGGYVALLRLRARDAGSHGRRLPKGRIALFALGLVLLAVATDWPVGPLAAGYLALFGTTQYLLLTLAVAPLLLLGLPDGPAGWSAPGTRRRSPFGLLVQPAVAVAIFGAVLLATHLPVTVDTLRPHAAGSFAIVVAWLASALLLWWPVAGPLPEARRLPYLPGVAYLFVPFLLPKVPGAFYIFGADALYDVYAQAPRVWSISPDAEQEFAGLLFWMVGSAMVLVALAVLIFRWYDEDQRMSEAGSLAVPADPRAVDLLFEAPGAWAALEELVRIVESALPEPRGAELAFAFVRFGRGETAAGTQVVLELRLASDRGTRAALAERIEQQYSAFLATVDGDRRAAIERRLAFRVTGYGARVR